VNMTISALIIDDEQLAREELKYLLDTVGGVDVLAMGTNGIEAVELIEEHRPELVFMDVQMPGLDGFAALQHIIDRRNSLPEEDRDPLPQVVFATAYEQYAVRAFDVKAVDYLLKPFDKTRVEQAVDRVRERIQGTTRDGSQSPVAESQLNALLRLLNQTQPALLNQAQTGSLRAPARLVVQAQSRLLLVDQSEICFAEIEEGLIRVVTQSFEGLSKCRTLEELLDQLDPATFWRAHRGYVVNINHIREVVPWFKSSFQLRMGDKKQTEIPVSRNQTRRLRELFNL